MRRRGCADRLTCAQAASAFLTKKVALDNAALTDPDHQTLPQRYMDQLANARDAAGQGITDPAHRAMFLASAQGVAGRAFADIQDYARAQAAEQYRGTLADTIDGNVQAAAQARGATDAETLLRTSHDLIDAAAENGFLTNDEAQAMRQDVPPAYAEAKAKYLIGKDPAEALRYLLGTDDIEAGLRDYDARRAKDAAAQNTQVADAREAMSGATAENTPVENLQSAQNPTSAPPRLSRPSPVRPSRGGIEQQKRDRVAALETYLQDPNVQAFLSTIAQAEGATYDTLFGGRKFTGDSRFPNQGKPPTASGRYQITRGTYNDLSKELGLNDFSPRTQDLMAVQLLMKKGALEPLLNGDLDTAVKAAAPVWASLPEKPGNPDSENPQDRRDKGHHAEQPNKSFNEIRRNFQSNLAAFSGSPF